MFLVAFLLCAIAFSLTPEAENQRLKLTNRALAKALAEMSVGAEAVGGGEAGETDVGFYEDEWTDEAIKKNNEAEKPAFTYLATGCLRGDYKAMAQGAYDPHGKEVTCAKTCYFEPYCVSFAVKGQRCWLGYQQDWTSGCSEKIYSYDGEKYPDGRQKTGWCDIGWRACGNAARIAGLKLGGKGTPFVGNYETKGCYYYTSGDYKGIAYYSTGGTDAQNRFISSKHSTKARVPGWDECVEN